MDALNNIKFFIKFLKISKKSKNLEKIKNYMQNSYFCMYFDDEASIFNFMSNYTKKFKIFKI